MDLNSFVFPAPTEDKYSELFINKGDILFIPKKIDNLKEFHIPCLYKQSSSKDETNKIFIYFHGNAEDIFNSNCNLQILKGMLPFNILSVEYPGYSIYYQNKSAETMEEDSLIIFDFLVNTCNVNPKNIILCGRSIGTGVATYLAANRNPGGLILISPIQSLRNTVKNIVGIMKYLIKDRFNNLERIKNVHCPLLVIHGQKDSLIPFEQSVQIAENAGGPYEIILPENMNHNELQVYDDFIDPISSFLKRHNLLYSDNSRINIDKKYFEIPDYLSEKKNLNNTDKITEIVRKILKI